MANELLTKGTKLSMKLGPETDYVELKGLTKVPDLGGKVDKVEVTNLSDGQKRYINGIKNLGDGLEFEFNYENEKDSAFYKLKAVQDSGKTASFKIEFPGGLAFTLDAEVSVSMDGAEVNKQVTFKASLTPASEMTMTAPTFA